MPEAQVRLVEGMYGGTKGRVMVGPRMLEEFNMTIEFIMVMELVKMKGVLGRMLDADNLAFGKHGLKNESGEAG